MAFDIGGAFSGGLGGAGAASMLGLGQGVNAAGAAIGAGLAPWALGLGLAGAALGGMGSGGGEQKTGYDIVRLPQYSWTEPQLKLTSDFVSQNLARLQRGEFPSYYEKALPQLREGLARPLQQTYYGRTGERGGSLSDIVSSAGAMSGVGPKALMAQQQKLARDYADRVKAIDEYLAEVGMNVMSRDTQLFPQLAYQAPSGPPTSIVAYGGSASPYVNPMQGFGQQALQALGQQQALGLTRGTQQPTTQYPTTTPGWTTAPAGTPPYMSGNWNPAAYAAPAAASAAPGLLSQIPGQAVNFARNLATPWWMQGLGALQNIDQRLSQQLGL